MEASRVSPERLEVLRRPPSWPPSWDGFEEPWGEPDVAERVAAAMDAELLREIAPGHSLYDRRCIAIAKCAANDDVLFAVGPEEVAVVHLTWARKPEAPPWPSTTFYASFDEFLASVPEEFSD